MPPGNGKPARPSKWCKKCGYALDGLSEPRCPECGREFDPAQRRTYRRKPPWSRLQVNIIRASVSILLAIVSQIVVLYWRPVLEWPARWKISRNPNLAIAKERPWAPTSYHTWYSKWAKSLGLPFATTIEHVAAGALTTDAELAAVRGLGGLKLLEIGNNRITDAGLVHIQGLVELAVLDISGTNITDEGLRRIRGLTNLQVLIVSGTHITDDGIAHLSGMKKLIRLGLSRTRVTDEGLKRIEDLNGLSYLFLSKGRVTKKGVEATFNIQTNPQANPALAIQWDDRSYQDMLHARIGVDDKAFDSLVAGIQEAERRLKNATIECEFRTGTEVAGPDGALTFQPGPVYSNLEVILDGVPGGMKRYKEDGVSEWSGGPRPYAEISLDIAFDGEISTYFDPSTRWGTVQSGRHRILNNATGWHTTEFDSLHFAYPDRRFSDILLEMRDVIEVNFRSETVDSAVEIFIPSREPRKYARKFWLDPNSGYAIVRQEATYGGANPMATCEEYELKQFGPGLWYPVSVVRRRPGSTEIDTLTASKVVLNKPGFDYSKDRFVVDFPPGTHISNETIGISLPVEVWRLINWGRPPILWISILIVIALAGVLFCVFVYRRLKSRRQHRRSVRIAGHAPAIEK
jgi:hypothetical protein